VLYSRILNRIEALDYDVFSARARVPTWHKAGTAARILVAGPPRTAAPVHVEKSRSHVPSRTG
jgi:15-cis-phytoene synthase